MWRQRLRPRKHTHTHKRLALDWPRNAQQNHGGILFISFNKKGITNHDQGTVHKKCHTPVGSPAATRKFLLRSVLSPGKRAKRFVLLSPPFLSLGANADGHKAPPQATAVQQRGTRTLASPPMLSCVAGHTRPFAVSGVQQYSTSVGGKRYPREGQRENNCHQTL